MRRHSTATLMGMTKAELVEYVRMAEHNQDVAEETLQRQAENVKDWIPVVRCCQCKYHKMCEDGTVLCEFHSEQGERDSRSGLYSVWMVPDDFCSYGERRTDNA